MSNATANPVASKGKGKLRNVIILGVVFVLAAAGGVTTPMFLSLRAADKDSDVSGEGGGATVSGKHAFLPFGDVVVNLLDERLARYLRAKLILVVPESQEKVITELLTKNKAILKNWLIGYLSDKSLQEVGGAAGVNRLRREIEDQFNNLLFPDGSRKIKDVLFEEFVVQ